jgi:hypothetical protein
MIRKYKWRALATLPFAIAGVAGSPAALADASCADAAASVSAASAAYVAAATSDPDSTAGIIGCTYPLMKASDFEAAIADAAGKAPNQDLAMFIVRLGMRLLTDNADVVPDVVRDVPPDVPASSS